MALVDVVRSTGAEQMSTHLVLVGGGHAHLHVLAAWARHKPPRCRLTLISPGLRQIYSGMLPGWIAGHYTLQQCTIALAPLARAADADAIDATVLALDADGRTLTLARRHGRPLATPPYDGPSPAAASAAAAPFASALASALASPLASPLAPVSPLPASAVASADAQPASAPEATPAVVIERLGFDLLSLDIGPVVAERLRSAFVGALCIRPINGFVDQCATWLDGVDRGANGLGTGTGGSSRPRQLWVVGGGLGGIEVALAAAWRARTRGAAWRVGLVAGQQGPAANLAHGPREHLVNALQQAGVTVLSSDAIGSDHESVHTADGAHHAADRVWLLPGAAAAAWPHEGGLAVDARGFIAVERTLRSASHPRIFAAGDCASVHGVSPAKNGVYAVRAGPLLAANLRAVVSGGALTPWQPQRNALMLVATGARHAVGTRGNATVHGAWVWRWKDWIDRRFVRRWQR